jgi:hypothetical protein
MFWRLFSNFKIINKYVFEYIISLLIYTLSFLPKKYLFSSLNICKNWNEILKNYLMFFSKLPINYHTRDKISFNEKIRCNY